jgi:hypothetical protein
MLHGSDPETGHQAKDRSRGNGAQGGGDRLQNVTLDANQPVRQRKGLRQQRSHQVHAGQRRCRSSIMTGWA